MSRLAQYARDWLADVIAGWNCFWFTPVDPATLAVIRICTGAMLFYTHLVWSFDLDSFFGGNPWISEDAMRTLRPDSYVWSYFFWIHSDKLLWTMHIAALVVFALLTLGLFSRLMSVLAFIATLSYITRVPGALFGLDQINLMLAMYLMIGPSGAAYSLDRLIARRRTGQGLPPAGPSVAANIAIRLVQLHMCIIYLFAGLSKLEGNSWWSGNAMWLAFGNYEYQSIDMTWMARHPLLVNLLTHLTIFWEIYYCALIWPRKLRPIMLALAVPMHLGIALCLGMMTFGLVMLIGNLAFVPPRIIRALFDRDSSKGRAGEGAESATPTASVQTGKRQPQSSRKRR